MKSFYYYLSLILSVIYFSCQKEDPAPTFTLSTTVSPTEGGKITVSPESLNFKEGEIVTLTAEANENWVFQRWEGDVNGDSVIGQITMNANKSVVSVFAKKDYPLILTIEGEGTVVEKIITNPSGKEYPHGTTVELDPIPKEGWVFESWGGDLSGNESPKTVFLDKEMNVDARFIPIKKSLLSEKLDNTVWIGDENYKGCDCGFTGLIGFKGGVVYELADHGSKEPIGCFPYNFFYRDYNGVIEDLKYEEYKISLRIISGPWDWYTEIEIINGKLRITSRDVVSNGDVFSHVQEYIPSTIKFEDYCK